MKDYKISHASRSVLDNSVLISGVARSGTTIVGKVVHTLQRVEYFFEPPAVVPILLASTTESATLSQFVLESYLYEDLFLGSIAGRNLNFNQNDDSCVSLVKSVDEIRGRQSESFRKVDLEKIASKYRLAFKIPGVTNYFQLLGRWYPNMSFIYVHREPIGTINSLLAKNWFSNDSLVYGTIRPNKWNCRGYVPYWVSEGLEEIWWDLSEIDRCAAYYLFVVDSRREANVLVDIDYDDMVESPQESFDKLFAMLGELPGPKTLDVIATIRARRKVQDTNLLRDVSSLFSRIREFIA